MSRLKHENPVCVCVCVCVSVCERECVLGCLIDVEGILAVMGASIYEVSHNRTHQPL